MLVADLSFWETVTAGFLNALFVALFVGVVAGLVVKWYDGRTAERRAAADALHQKLLREAEARHQEQLQTRQLEYQTRAALRETYAELLVAQRRSREASLKLGQAGRASRDLILSTKATSAHGEFIDHYHRLNLDASDDMWRDARGLRAILDDLLEEARNGNAARCEVLHKLARKARQNLEGSFRDRLGYELLQDRNPLDKYDKSKP